MFVRQKMWNAMRVLKSFTTAEIQHCNGENEPLKFHSVRKYTTILERAGYVAEITKGRFRLIKNTGRLAPTFTIIKTEKGLFIRDNNLKILVPIIEANRKSNRTHKVNARISKIKDNFKDIEEFSYREVARVLDSSDSSARNDIARLKKQGIVTCIRIEQQYYETGKPIRVGIYKMIDKEK